MKNVNDGLPLFQAHHGWLARVAEDRELVDVDWRNERSMNSARHECILTKSASHLHLIALALSDKSVEEMVSLLKLIGQKRLERGTEERRSMVGDLST